MMAQDDVKQDTPTTSYQPPQDDNPYELDSHELDGSRRTFIKALIGVFAAAWSVVAIYPVMRFLWPSSEAGEQLTELVLGSVDDFPPGSAKNFKFGTIPGIFIHTPEGQMQAFNAKCTHLGCTVQYKEDINNIFCACHGGVYDLNTGNNISGPPPKPLDKLLAEVVDGNVVIKRT